MMNKPALSGLYAITPDFADTPALIRAVTAVLDGGCRLLQYRDKTADNKLRRARATALQAICTTYGARLIINDDVTLAQSVGAAGAHLGQNDGEVAFARKMLGDTAIIGVSCYNDFARAGQAAAAGASYIAFGAVYASPSKPRAPLAPHTLIARAHAELPLPVCAIGGITLANAAPLLAAGASLLAVISDLFQLNPTQMTQRAAAYQKLFQGESPT